MVGTLGLFNFRSKNDNRRTKSMSVGNGSALEGSAAGGEEAADGTQGRDHRSDLPESDQNEKLRKVMDDLAATFRAREKQLLTGKFSYMLLLL